jgi:predicted extracellular nuclease
MVPVNTTSLRSVRLLPVVALLAALLAGFAPGAAPARAAASDLFFSEYIEGSSNNKALEIYNGTGAATDRSAGGYSIQMFFNGSASAGLTINLAGTVASGDVFVLAHSSADAAILAQADQTSGAGLFNGDDAVVLRKGTAVIDSIGQVGFDPGSEWGSGNASTADNTLVRKVDVCAGDVDTSNAFDPVGEWDGFANNTFGGLGSHASTCSGPADPVINEFSASTAGADVEYLELFGTPATDYSAYSVLQIEGDFSGSVTGTVDSVTPMGTTDVAGLFLASLPANALENGTVSLLLVEGFSGAAGNDLDSNDDGTFDATPWARLVDSVAVNDGGASDLTYGVPTLGVSYDGQSFAPGGASRIPDGADTDAAADWVRNDFDLAGIPGNTGTLVAGEALNTPGAPNQVFEEPPPGGACNSAPAITRISVVQGNGAATPCQDQQVTVEGVVVGDYEGPAPTLRGFYLQEEDADQDSDPLTSEGIFVFNGSNDSVSLGQLVRVTGAVSEFQDQTQISASAVQVVGSATVTAAQVAMPFPSADYLEQYEGMLVTFPQTLYVTEHFQLGRFGQILMSSSDRLRQPTNVVAPGAAANALQAENNLNKIIVDDNLNNQNPDPILFGRGGNPLTALNTLRGGDSVAGLVGVMTYTWAGNSASGNAYRVRPVGDLSDLAPDSDVPVFQASNPRPSAVPEVGGTVRVVGMNLLNFFNTFSGCTNGVGGAATDCRGANDQAEFDRQWPKTVAAILAMDPDVVGVNEIENDGYGPSSAIQFLVDRLNDATAPGTYALIDVDAATGQVNALGTDAIKVSMLYKPGVVTPVGQTAALNTVAFVNGGDPEPRNRPSLAQAFQVNAGGERFIVDVNHLKSKGSACVAPDAGDGQGNCNQVRVNAATELVNWLASDPTGTGDPDILLIGDYNSYAMEDPITVIKGARFTNLIAELLGRDAYSYVFDGQWGYLDQALASASMASQVSGVGDYHINSDEPSVLDYNTDFKSAGQIESLYSPDQFRVSDHDPVIVGLALDSAPPVTTATVSGATNPLCPADCYAGSATVTLSASDATGVASTQYSINGGALQNYTGPFVITADGTSTVSFFSTDTLGNVEPAQQVTVKVTSFLAVPVLDTFNRRNGPLGPNWIGDLGNYLVLSNQARILTSGAAYWNAPAFGADQEAFVTLTDISPMAQSQGLLLKVRARVNRIDHGYQLEAGAIAVSYDARGQRLVVESYRFGQGWTTLATFDGALPEGSLLSARALADGTVRVYVNCALVGTADAGSFFAGQGGGIGLYNQRGNGGDFDNFGGGTTP